MAENFDFRGYATRYNVLCGDGRTIKPGAFKHMDGMKIPLVWSHGHTEVSNVLGHAILEHRDDGVYAYGYFNSSEAGVASKEAVQHKDVEALSIYANKLVERNHLVHSGQIRELSLVLAGANPGAFIEDVGFAHGDDTEDEVIIYGGQELDEEKENDEVKHSDKKANPKPEEEEEEGELEHADMPKAEDDMTVGDVFNTLTDVQKKVVYAMISEALGSGDMAQSDEEGENFMKENIFENGNEDNGAVLSHADAAKFATEVFNDMGKYGSFKESFLAHAGTYGIDNISYLFPDARTLDNEPTFDTRRMGWVQGWLSGTRHTPFSRIKKLWADLTPDAARAKGYITGNQKVEQVFAVLKRTTEPTTVYKKQKLDRDDVTDITDFDVVAWMWREMRFMLDEEIARAALVGDGRTFGVDDDAIDPSKVRPIYGDDPIFVHYLSLDVTVTDYGDIIDQILLARVNYKGTGTPNLYTTNAVLMGMLLLKDTTDRYIYQNVDELARRLRVANIVEVEVLEGIQRTNTSPAFTADLLGILVNPTDYTYGADAGGQISTFDDFDIDYNQMKYLIETRVSGSLLNPKSALAVERKTA